MTKGQRIKAKREELNIGQTELANKIQVSKQTLYKYENDIVTNIPSDKIELLSKALNTTPAYIMGWEGDDDDTHKALVDAYVKRQEVEVAIDMYEKYKSASPAVRAAIELLLKSPGSDS